MRVRLFFMLTVCLGVLATTLSSAQLVTQAPDKLKDRQLVIGRSVTLQTDYEIGDVAITDQSIIDYVVRDSRREIYLNPLKEGRVTLTLWNTKDQVRDTLNMTVVSTALSTVMEDIKTQLRGAVGIKIRLLDNNTIELSGEANSNTELELIQELGKKYPQVRSTVVLSESVMAILAERIQSAINIPGVSAVPMRGTIVLQGVVYSPDMKKKAATIAQLYKEDAVDLIEVRPGDRRPGMDKTVKLDVYFMEIKNSALRSFGINWAPGSSMQPAQGMGGNSAGGGGGAGLLNFDAVLGFVFNLLPKIRWIHETNRGRVLEKPSFIVKSGEAIDFYSGTQIPYYSQGSVTFKEVGIRVNAEPIVSAQDIDLKIKVSVSSPSSTISKGIDTNELQTTAFVESGRAVVLGGLVRNNDTKSYNKVPEGIDTSGALFTLFLSRDFQTNKSQFYIFVQPTILERPSPAESELKRWLELNEAVDQARR